MHVLGHAVFNTICWILDFEIVTYNRVHAPAYEARTPAIIIELQNTDRNVNTSTHVTIQFRWSYKVILMSKELDIGSKIYILEPI